MDMVSVGEFDLLRDARQDIRTQPWARRANRDATNTYFNVKRAREEIRRLNVEIPRLFTSMIDEHVDYLKAIKDTESTDPALSRELAARHRYRDVVNARVVAWLWKTSQLAGFSGKVVYGHRKGRDSSPMEATPLPSWATFTGPASVPVGDPDDPDDPDAIIDDDEDGEGIPGVGGAAASGRFVQFVDGLSGDPIAGDVE